MTLEAFAASIAKYDYFIVGDHFEAFKKKFSTLVPADAPADTMLLKVVAREGGVSLVPLPLLPSAP